jgi:hypothetical protein
LSSRPSTASPTGARIGVPRARAAALRRSPAVPPERHHPHHCRAEVLLHFRDQGLSKIPFDRDGLIERGQHPSGEGDVDDRAMDRGDAARPQSRFEWLD